MQKTKNKTNKYVLLATYVVAVLCLLAGLFLPLFNGKEILALKLGDIFKSLMNKGEFGLTYKIALFGIEKLSFDFIALVLVLYTVVTALAVLSFVPVVLSLRKRGQLAKKFYYGVEIAAIIVLTLFFTAAIYFYDLLVGFKNMIGFNLVIAGCGTVIALLVLCGLDKKKRSTIKIGLFLLSLVGFLALLDLGNTFRSEPSLSDIVIRHKYPLIGDESGADYLTALFAMKMSDVLATATDVRHKALIVLAALASTVVLLNFFIDTIKLATKKDKKIGCLFDIVRYGCEIALAVCVLVTGLICKEKPTLMLIAVLVVAAAQLAIVVVRFILAARRRKSRKARRPQPSYTEPVEDNPEEVAEPALLAADEEAAKAGEPEPVEEPAEEVGEPVEAVGETEGATEEPADGEGAEEATGEMVETEPTPPVPDEDGYVDPELDAQYQQLIGERKEATMEEIPSGYDDEDLEDVELYEPEKGTTYLVPLTDPDAEPVEEVAEETPAEEPVEETTEESAPIEEPVEEVAEEAAPVEEPVEEVAEEAAPEEEPVEEVAEEAAPVEEPVEEVAEEAAPVEEPVEEVAEEPAPVEEPVEEVAEEPAPVEEPVEEVAEEAAPVEEPVEEAAEEAAPVEEPVEEVAEEPAPVEEPVEEVAEPVTEADDGLEEPANNPFREVKPYNPYEKHNNPFRGFEEPPQPYNPYRQQVQYEKIQPTRPAYEPRPQPKQYEQPVRPLRPRPIIQEFKPVPPVSEQPPKETRVYTIDTIYAGPIDAFISKLSNDERIEFAKTFIEKNKGNLGSIPDYVVGGDNRKFFSAAFIYLGRIRGMVSDGLLNKMYKELNLF